MSNETSAAVRDKLIELLQQDQNIMRMFLVIDAKSFKAALSINAQKETLSLGDGSFVVLMLSPDAVSGMESGIYDPEARLAERPYPA